MRSLNKLLIDKEQTISQCELELEKLKFKNMQSEYELNQKLDEHEAKENQFRILNNQFKRNSRADVSSYEDTINDMKVKEAALIEEVTTLKSIIKKLKSKIYYKIKAEKSIISPDQTANECK